VSAWKRKHGLKNLDIFYNFFEGGNVCEEGRSGSDKGLNYNANNRKETSTVRRQWNVVHKA